MHDRLKLLSGTAILALCLAAPGCTSNRNNPESNPPMPPGAEKGGAGADGADSAPVSDSNNGEATPPAEPASGDAAAPASPSP